MAIYAKEFKFDKQGIDVIVRYLKIKSCSTFGAWFCHWYKHSLASRCYGFRFMGVNISLTFRGLSKKDKALAKEFGLDKALGINCD